jgi:DNA repair exonuclease SbcCD ATPase subunit
VREGVRKLELYKRQEKEMADDPTIMEETELSVTVFGQRLRDLEKRVRTVEQEKKEVEMLLAGMDERLRPLEDQIGAIGEHAGHILELKTKLVELETIVAGLAFKCKIQLPPLPEPNEGLGNLIANIMQRLSQVEKLVTRILEFDAWKSNLETKLDFMERLVLKMDKRRGEEDDCPELIGYLQTRVEKLELLLKSDDERMDVDVALEDLSKRVDALEVAGAK